ncbi:MAG TPA: glycerol kinase GlpK [Chlamydiales bacterium]|nr:glycerol kinase GlpK [Chlamydiales bacterium]
MAHILALDQGTTSSRALVINAQGKVLSIAQKEFKQYFPQSGFVEHDAEEIWSSQYAVANEALAKAKLDASDIAGIGITNQRETTILWDRKTGTPIFHAIVWQDRRTAPLCTELKQKKLEPLFSSKTGLLLDPYFSGTKVRWLLDHIPGARSRAEKGELAFGTVDTWLVWKLSRGKLHITDATNASRTLLFNIHEGKWDEELLKILEIPRSLLPEVKSCSEIYGHTGDHVFTASIPIAGIAGDQQAALFGQGCFDAGKAKSTYGTGCFILMNTGLKPVASKNHLLTTIALKMGKETHYALEGSVFNAGTAIQWFRDNLGLIKTSSEIDTLAATVPDTGGVYFVPAFTGLGAPHWDPQARGTILGISRGTTAAHLARAVLESIAFQATDVFKAMESDSNIRLSEIRVDGGAVVSEPLMQFQADLIQTAVLRPKTSEITALGAAFLAGLAVGLWKKPSELSSLWQLDRKFTPQMDPERRKKLLETWSRAVERAKHWEIP